MRVLSLVVFAALGCADAPAPVAGPATSPPGYRVVVDSLGIEEPALRYTVRIGAPRLEATDGAALSREAEGVNAAIRDSVETLAASFRPEAPPPEFEAPAYEVRVEGGPQAVHVTDDVLSVLVSVYAYTGGAHGTTFFLPLTFDLRTGEPVALASLFRPDAPWGSTLATHVERSVVAQLTTHLGAADARQALYTEGLDDVRRGEVAWTLGPDSLHVWIPPYQLAAYAAGSFDVAVPYASLAPLARPRSLLDPNDAP